MLAFVLVLTCGVYVIKYYYILYYTYTIIYYYYILYIIYYIIYYYYIISSYTLLPFLYLPNIHSIRVGTWICLLIFLPPVSGRITHLSPLLPHHLSLSFKSIFLFFPILFHHPILILIHIFLPSFHSIRVGTWIRLSIFRSPHPFQFQYPKYLTPHVLSEWMVEV